MTEEEENENLLDGFSVSGISKALGGSSRIIKIILFVIVAALIIYMVKSKKIKVF